jgi:porin
MTGNRLPIQEVAGGNYAKLTEFTIEQKLLGDKLDLRMGYYAMGNDLGGMALGCNLVNAAFCAHPLSMSGDTGWYNYPNARWGVTIRYRLLKELTVRTGINQVNPDLSLRRNGFKPFAGGSTGFLVPVEFEYDPGSTPNSSMLPGHYKLGAYYDSTTTTRQAGSDKIKGRYGIYLLADQMIWRGRMGGACRSLDRSPPIPAPPRRSPGGMQPVLSRPAPSVAAMPTRLPLASFRRGEPEPARTSYRDAGAIRQFHLAAGW